MIANKARHGKKLPPVREKPEPDFDPIDGFQIVYSDLPIDRPVCPKPAKIRSGPPIVYDKLYITDDKTVYKWASKKLVHSRVFRFIYWLFRWFIDYNSFSPIWRSVLYVDEIVTKNRRIFVKDALVVNCQSIEAFEKVIPYISGNYTRLMIHGGDINLDQLKRLLLPSVIKIEVTAFLKLESDEYDDAVQLIMGHVRGFRYAFKLDSTWTLKNEVKAAVKKDRNLATDWRHHCNVIHWTRDWHNYALYIATRLLYARCMFFYKIDWLQKHSDNQYVGWLKLAYLISLIVIDQVTLTSKPDEESS